MIRFLGGAKALVEVDRSNVSLGPFIFFMCEGIYKRSVEDDVEVSRSSAHLSRKKEFTHT